MDALSIAKDAADRTAGEHRTVAMGIDVQAKVPVK